MKYKFIFALILTAFSAAAVAESRWVTDEFEVMLRSGKSTQNAIVRQMRSGSRVELLEVDEAAGYSRVQLSPGVEGWVLSRYLLRTPTARLRLPEVEARLGSSESQRAALAQDIQSLRQSRSELERELAELKSSNASLEAQLERISRLSADTIQVDNQNAQLRIQLDDSESRIQQLSMANEELSGRGNREWFVIGAAVLLTGLLLGLIIPRIRWRRKSSWGEL